MQVQRLEDAARRVDEAVRITERATHQAGADAARLAARAHEALALAGRWAPDDLLGPARSGVDEACTALHARMQFQDVVSQRLGVVTALLRDVAVDLAHVADAARGAPAVTAVPSPSSPVVPTAPAPTGAAGPDDPDGDPDDPELPALELF